jgi:cytochrome c oxidase assembly protein subunit 15
MGKQSDLWLHRFAVFLALAVLGLISAGALVTSKEAGLSVPDWPLSYGSLNPPRWWQIENVRAEHGHRLLAGTVALLTVALAGWMSRRESRRWVRRLAWVAVGAVLLQAILGGITVLLFLPTPVSVGHAGLAELFLCLTVTLAVVTSRWWRGGSVSRPELAGVRNGAVALTVLVYCQILVGAVMRHSGAGLAIPDFPLAFGRLIPPHWDFAVGIHFAHRLGAVVVAIAVGLVFSRVIREAREEFRLFFPASLLVALVVVQIALGATVVLTEKAVVVNTLHVATGASILATSLLLTLQAWRFTGRRPATLALGEELRGTVS